MIPSKKYKSYRNFKCHNIFTKKEIKKRESLFFLGPF